MARGRGDARVALPVPGRPRALPRRVVPLAVAGLLTTAGCAAEAPARDPQRVVTDAVDTFQSDNTGYYELGYELADESLEEAGYYRVTPDAVGTLRTHDTGDGAETVRYLRLFDKVWLELPDVDVANPRDTCYLRGDAATVVETAGLAADELPASTAAVEVVLTLEHGREEDDALVADASLRTVATAFSRDVRRSLDVPGRRVDVPVRLDIEDGRLVGWSVALADVAEAAPGGDALDLGDDPGDLAVTFGEPGADVDFSAPDQDHFVPADASERRRQRFVEDCA